MNRIVLVGRLESTPELRFTSTGIPVANFSLSVRRSIPNGQGRYERDLFRIVTWRKLAETCCKFLERGRMIAVDGKLQNRIVTSPNGDRRVIAEIHADDVRFLEGARPRGESQEYDPEQQVASEPTPNENIQPEEDISSISDNLEINCEPEYEIEDDPWVPEEDGTLLDPSL